IFYSGTLSYHQFLDRSHKINVRNGDNIVIEETMLSKIVNIIFLTTMLFFILFNLYSLKTGVYFDSLFVRSILITLAISLTVLFIVSPFFPNHKFTIENEK